MSVLRAFALCSLAMFACAETTFAQVVRGPVIPKPMAARVGLDRAWFTQVGIDRSRDRIANVTIHGDSLFVQSERGLLHALDAETGRTLWNVQIGNPDYPTLAPAANEDVVALVNGSTLYVVKRGGGEPVWNRRVGSGPGAGPAISGGRVFVPMINGTIEGYLLEDQKLPPWIYSSFGRALVQPLATKDSVCWPTDRGYFYVARSVNPGVRFRVETNDSINSRPSYQKPYFFAASRDGYVYSVHELSGNQKWRFSAGDPISEPPVAIGKHVYVCPDHAGMYCVSVETGDHVWWTPRVMRFLGASPDRVYGADKFGRLFVIDAKSGTRLATIQMPEVDLFVVNTSTDRVYLGTTTGVLQCLHDTAVADPIRYDLDPNAGEEETDEKGKPAVPKKPAGAEPDNPFGGDAAGDNPFGGDAKPKADDNPFGGDAGGDEKPKADDNPFGGDAGGDDNPFG